jgi:hypothetical protein
MFIANLDHNGRAIAAPALPRTFCRSRVRYRAVVLDDAIGILDEELLAAIGAKQLHVRMPEVLVMDVETLLAFGAARIEMLDHIVLSRERGGGTATSCSCRSWARGLMVEKVEPLSAASQAD